MKSFILSALLAMIFMVNGYSNVLSLDGLETKDVVNEDIITEAYIYGFPLVLMEATKNVLTDTATLNKERAPINQFLNKKTFPDPSFKEVVSPNADTLYSQAWLDLTKEPIIFSVPDMGDRYYLFPMLDEWTNVFFSPGTRTTGNGKNNFAITSPSWQGVLPEGVKPIKSPTDIVWIIGRIQTNGPKDYPAVNKLQEQFKLTPLSAWGTNYIPPFNVPITAHIDSKAPPIDQVMDMDGIEFFKKLAQILKNTPIPSRDAEFVKRFEKFGFVPGKDFDAKELSPKAIQDISLAIKKAQNQIKEGWNLHPFAKTENGWGVMIKDIGNYGTNYDIRAAVAFGGLGANLPEDAIYPATTVDSAGQLLNGKFRYRIHFDKDKLPPVGAFWSITMYNDHQFFIKNSLNRYAIGDRDQLKLSKDGSLDIYIQNLPPSDEKESNWLPAPEGDFNLLMRLYEPKKEVLNGTWKPPEVKKIN